MSSKCTIPGRQCRAKCRRTQQQCQRWAIRGGTVCRVHGGAAPHVKRKAAERIAEYVARLVDPDRALAEAASISYSDVSRLFDDKGNLLPIRQWPKSMHRAVASVEVAKRNLEAGDDRTDDIVKIRLWDKTKALEMLFKHLGLQKERIEHSGGIEIRWQESE